MKYSKEEVLKFANSYKFKSYQKIRLPYGIEIEGTNLDEMADTVLQRDLSGKSVVDIGCNYGYFCHEAKKRNAKEVIGVEINKETARIARKITDIIGDNVKIIDGIDKLNTNKIYDIILLLNVVHHLNDPFQFIERLSKKCKQLVIEFPTPNDEAFIVRNNGSKIKFASLNIFDKVFYKIKLIFIRFVFTHLGKSYGVIGVGNINYHNCFYFNRKSFDYAFLVHNKIFKKITYKASPRFPHRLIAFCSV